jgi:hypothetical protein
MDSQPTKDEQVNAVDLSREIVDDLRVKKFIKAARNGSHGFHYMAAEDRLRIISMLKELLRHRELEERAFWGDDDE